VEKDGPPAGEERERRVRRGNVMHKERQRERRRRVPFLASTDTDPVTKSAGDRTPVKDGSMEGGRPPRGSVMTGERASRRERERERERERGGFGWRRPNASEAAPGRGRPASERAATAVLYGSWRESCVGGEMKI
jgi:hypothetical protein